MPRNRDDSSPLEAKRRQLEEQERLLAQKRRELKEQLESNGSPAAAKIDEPPVWRMEDEHDERPLEPTPARRRHLARQRRRDRLIALACIALLLIVLVVLLWVAWVHNMSPASNA
jgi:ferric-dicitrate binding protein FerR (iron transport regulator)